VDNRNCTTSTDFWPNFDVTLYNMRMLFEMKVLLLAVTCVFCLRPAATVSVGKFYIFSIVP